MISTAYNMDCMDYMASLDDNAFDIAIVDPPYGINAPNMNMGSYGKYKSTATLCKKSRFDKGGGKLKNRVLNTMNCDWDMTPPTKEYFDELFRVSKNQIIFGANYFPLPPCRCIVVWDKIQPWKNFSQVEIAWTSFNAPAKLFRYSTRGGSNREKKIHPTQKPVKLYTWLMQEFCKPGNTILDTHLGSGSSRIAAYHLGFDFVGIEIDQLYFEAQEQRFEKYKDQP